MFNCYGNWKRILMKININIFQLHLWIRLLYENVLLLFTFQYFDDNFSE